MRPTIIYFENEKILSEDTFSGSFAEANEVAQRAVERGLADRAEVHDELGNKRFQFPKILGSARSDTRREVRRGHDERRYRNALAP